MTSRSVGSDSSATSKAWREGADFRNNGVVASKAGLDYLPELVGSTFQYSSNSEKISVWKAQSETFRENGCAPTFAQRSWTWQRVGDKQIGAPTPPAKPRALTHR